MVDSSYLHETVKMSSSHMPGIQSYLQKGLHLTISWGEKYSQRGDKLRIRGNS